MQELSWKLNSFTFRGFVCFVTADVLRTYVRTAPAGMDVSCRKEADSLCQALAEGISLRGLPRSR